jgi:hypothetical protein
MGSDGERAACVVDLRANELATMVTATVVRCVVHVLATNETDVMPTLEPVWLKRPGLVCSGGDAGRR